MQAIFHFTTALLSPVYRIETSSRIFPHNSWLCYCLRFSEVWLLQPRAVTLGHRRTSFRKTSHPPEPPGWPLSDTQPILEDVAKWSWPWLSGELFWLMFRELTTHVQTSPPNPEKASFEGRNWSTPIILRTYTSTEIIAASISHRAHLLCQDKMIDSILACVAGIQLM